MLHTSLITFAQVLSNREFCSVCVKTFSTKDNETKKRKEKKRSPKCHLKLGSYANFAIKKYFLFLFFSEMLLLSHNYYLPSNAWC